MKKTKKAALLWRNPIPIYYHDNLGTPPPEIVREKDATTKVNRERTNA